MNIQKWMCILLLLVVAVQGIWLYNKYQEYPLSPAAVCELQYRRRVELYRMLTMFLVPMSEAMQLREKATDPTEIQEIEALVQKRMLAASHHTAMAPILAKRLTEDPREYMKRHRLDYDEPPYRYYEHQLENICRIYGVEM